MEFLAPTSLAAALDAKAAYPDAVPICGGTDMMVELNFDRRRPTALLDLIASTRAVAVGSPMMGRCDIGAGVTVHPR